MARSCAFALIAGFIYKPARRTVESVGVGPPTVLFPLPLPFVSKPRPVGKLPRLSDGRGKAPAVLSWKGFVMASLVLLLPNRDDLILLDFQPKCPSLVWNQLFIFPMVPVLQLLPPSFTVFSQKSDRELPSLLKVTYF